jgi:integrase
VLAQLERRAEMVRSGVLSEAEDMVADHRRSPIELHVASYIASLNARGVTKRHALNQRRLLTAVLDECGFKSLQDVRREKVERWLTTGENLRRSARTRNTYLSAARWFLTWTVETDRILANPLARIPLADEKADRRRQPRALTADEVERLMDAARRRPLVEAQKFNRGWRKGQNGAHLRPETAAKLEHLGQERALIYKTLVLTGLRLGELSALRVCDAVLHGPRPHLLLDARHEKNREGSTIPLRADLAADLRSWIAGKPADEPLLRLGANQVKVLNRDLDFAGIQKRDDRGRTACIHSLRHTHATLMSRGGVGPRVVQAAMRHATMDLTMQVYTDPRLLDVAAALDVLPSLPLTPRIEAAAS